jgi:hypothetical protein
MLSINYNCYRRGYEGQKKPAYVKTGTIAAKYYREGKEDRHNGKPDRYAAQYESREDLKQRAHRSTVIYQEPPVLTRAQIVVEKDSDPTQSFSYTLIGIIGGLSEEDHEAIEEAIYSAMDGHGWPEEGIVFVDLKEAGERQDVFWVKFYIVTDIYILALT